MGFLIFIVSALCFNLVTCSRHDVVGAIKWRAQCITTAAGSSRLLEELSLTEDYHEMYLLHFVYHNILNTYKAGFIRDNVQPGGYVSIINEAAKDNVDILVLPSPKLLSSDGSFETVCGTTNYDEIVRNVSSAARSGGLYVVVHLFESNHCKYHDVIVRNNLVFNRQGSIVSFYRKPYTDMNCNTTTTSIGKFTTDFGVTFGNIMEDDLVLQNLEALDLKNFVLAGKLSSDIGLLDVSQFSSSWAYTTGANLVSPSGIYAGKAGLKTADNKIVVVALQKEGISESSITHPVVIPKPHNFPEDLSQFIIRPLDIEASNGGHKETVCYEDLCCEFYVKTTVMGSKQNEMNYGLAVFNGLRNFGYHTIGVQNCAVYACIGLYKRTCDVGTQNSVTFERISISGNFSKENSSHFPVILSSTTSIPSDHFSFVKTQKVTIDLVDTQNLLGVGIFSRDYSKDFDQYRSGTEKSDTTFDIYDYIYNEDMQQFFDYLWIRLRVLIFIVSIYILEMM